MVVVLLVAATSLFFTRAVVVKMLPFDDKNEIQIVVDMPEDASLESTAGVATDIALALREIPEVADWQVYVGASAPVNFNGLVRHYYLRTGNNVADVQVNLIDKSERKAKSHDLAKRLRPIVQELAERSGTGANVKVVEVPPGPPVLSTLVAEVYGRDRVQQEAAALQIRELFEAQEGVVDVDWSLISPQIELTFVVDEQKAALTGVSRGQIVRALAVGLGGEDVTHISDPTGRRPVPVRVRLEEADRSSAASLSGLHVRAASGAIVPIGELVVIRRAEVPQPIDRKNGRRVVYVTADVAGAEESPVYAILDLKKRIAALDLDSGVGIGQLYARQPGAVDRPVMKWDGEWQVTYEVFRDLGIAFAGALLLIYTLLVAWFGSFVTPLVMMIAIPLTLIGIAPGHVLFGVFFTATSMIGMIALAGIMVRNGILLIDYLEARIRQGVPLERAVVEAGAVRTRPIVLTAGTVIIGAIVILFDPIFEGLAVALIAGSFASTVLTLIVVPGVYYLVRRSDTEEEGAAA